MVTNPDYQSIKPSQLFSAPEFVNWNYCYPCNLNCRHCYSRAQRYPQELSYQQYKMIANQLADQGVLTIAFGGGEPLLRKDLLEINQLLSSRGVETFLTSNGWFLNQSSAEALMEGGLNKLLISLDHASPSKNDAIRGNGSYSKAVSAMSLAVRLGLKTFISCVVSNLNYNQLETIIDLGKSIGVQGIELKKFRPTGNGFVNLQEFALSTEKADFVVDQYDGRKAESFSIEPIGFRNDNEAKICPCGWRSACLRPNGDVTHCSYSDSVLGNLTMQSLHNIWVNSASLNKIRFNGACEGAQGVSSAVSVVIINKRPSHK